jgi:hypothetical protein
VALTEQIGGRVPRELQGILDASGGGANPAPLSAGTRLR